MIGTVAAERNFELPGGDALRTSYVAALCGTSRGGEAPSYLVHPGGRGTPFCITHWVVPLRCRGIPSMFVLRDFRQLFPRQFWCYVVCLRASSVKAKNGDQSRHRAFPLAVVSRGVVTDIANASEHRPASSYHREGFSESSD